MRPPLAIAALVAQVLLGCSVVPEAQAGSNRVVAVGDLHGDLDNALKTLRLAGIVDDLGAWSGGDATLVQTGDITDRGPDSRALIALLQRLEVEAAASGGQVIALLGNHEVMNMTGDWRYVHPGDLLAFGGEQQRRAALAPAGSEGAWLRQKDAVVRVGDTIFVHGGVHPAIAQLGIERINAGVRDGLNNAGDPRLSTALLGPQGPFWYRGYVNDPEAEACPRLERALTSLKARRMVVGHTTQQAGRILERCGGRLQVIDIGIAAAYGGHIGAWTSINGDAKARYVDGERDLQDPA